MHDYLEKSLSVQRVQTYKTLAAREGETRSADRLYQLNILYSKELYVILGALEVVVRNRFQQALAKHYKKNDWFSLSLLKEKHKEQINKAIEHLVREKQSNYVIDDVIAQLNFGFWVHLCDRPYEKTLWKNCLFYCFPFYGMKPDRQQVENRLNICLKLRNKIAHMEPIIKYEDVLIQDYRNINQLLYALCPKSQKWFEGLCNFETIWNNRFEETSA